MSYILRNVMFDLVRQKAENIIENSPEISFDEKNILDVCAIVLNNIPPKYVVTNEGEAYTRLEFLKIQFKVDIITEILKAIEKVKKNP